VELDAAKGNIGPPEETLMRGAFVASLVAIALGAVSAVTALAQDKKEMSPGAVTSTSKAVALPSGGNAVKGGERPSHSDIQGGAGQSAMTSGDAGLVAPNTKNSEKARTN
jgi:hypothetical protein